jgi:hypothetical protein
VTLSKLARRLCEAPKKLCEGHCARPVGAAKSNSSKARREGRQVVWPGQVLELVARRIHLVSGCAAPAEGLTLDSQLTRDPTSGCIATMRRASGLIATLKLVSTGTSMLTNT